MSNVTKSPRSLMWKASMPHADAQDTINESRSRSTPGVVIHDAPHSGFSVSPRDLAFRFAARGPSAGASSHPVVGGERLPQRWPKRRVVTEYPVSVSTRPRTTFWGTLTRTDDGSERRASSRVPHCMQKQAP